MSILNNKTVLMVIAPIDFRDEEYFEPKAVLEAAGARVETTSTMAVTTSKAGKTVKADLQLGEIFGVDHDALVFVGGSGAEIYLAMVKVHKLAKDYLEAGKVVGAICIAPAILANAELLKDKQATAFADQQPALKKGGAQFVDKPVVQDGNIITANGPEAATAFGEALRDQIAKSA